jgi:hypothetical protein
MFVISKVPVSAAISGVEGFAIFIGGLTLLLAAMGAIKQIPGLDWLISEGAQFMISIGDAMGRFVGAIVGGFLGQMSNAFPAIGENLSKFMTNCQPFLDGARSIDPSVMEGIQALASAILIMTGASVLDSLTSWLTGGSSFAKFGEQLTEFAPAFRSFYDQIKDIDGTVIEQSANAALALAAFADNIPNEGGIASWFAGDNTLSMFSEGLSTFGPSLKAFAQSVSGLNVADVEAAANAATAIAVMANEMPNEGGLAALFAGENSLALIAPQLVPFGQALSEYAKTVSGLDASAVEASAAAGQMLAVMANEMPNEGGVASWFAGENSLALIAPQLVPFGKALSEYAKAVGGMDTSAVEASAAAAQVLAAFATNIPNEGGVASWFAGDNTLAMFAEGLVPFGKAMKSYSDSIGDFKETAVVSSARAAEALVAVAENIPNEGGVASWFAGDNKLGAFAEELIPFGKAMKSYSNSMGDFKEEAVLSSARAAEALVTVVDQLGKVESSGWFKKGTDLSTFAADLVPFGKAMKSYSNSMGDFKEADVISSARAAEALVTVVDQLSKVESSGWFKKGTDLSDFAADLEPFGASMKVYSDSVGEFKEADVIASASAAEALVAVFRELSTIDDGSGWWSKGSTLATFAKDLIPFGEAMATYATAVSTVFGDDNKVEVSANAATALVAIFKELSTIDDGSGWWSKGSTLATFAKDLIPFGESMASYSTAISSTFGDEDKITASTNAATALVAIFKELSTIDDSSGWQNRSSTLATFAKDLVPFGEAMVAYATTISTSFGDGNNVEASANAATALVGVFEKLSKLNDSSAWWNNSSTLATFAEDLVPFGEAMAKYSTAVSNFDSLKVTSSKNGADALVGVFERLSKLNDSSAWWNNSSTLATFAKDLVPFGEAMVKYSTTVSTAFGDDNKVTASANAATELVKVVTALSGIDEGTGILDRTTYLKQLTVDLVALGTALKEYSDAVADIGIYNVNLSISAVSNIVTLAKGMSEINKDTFSNFGSGLKDLANIGVTEFTNAFINSEEAVDSAVATMIGYADDQVVDLTDDAYTNMKTLADGFTDAIDDVKADMETSMKDNINGIFTAIQNNVETAKSTMATLVLAFYNAIVGKAENFFTAGSYLVNRVISGIRVRNNALVTECQTIAQNAVNGFVNKINQPSNQSAIKSAGRGMGNSLLSGARESLDTHSPSKETAKLGVYAVQGLINGMNHLGYQVYQSGQTAGDTVLESMRSAMSTIPDILQSDMDMSPVITPVIDMSQVESGMNSTFGRYRSYATEWELAQNVANSAVSRVRETARYANPDDVLPGNSDNRTIQITNHYTVRSDLDITKINTGLRNIMDRYAGAKGVTVKT